MTATDSQELPEGIDPESSPFEAWPVEGMPYPRGSDEDQAIRELLGLPPWRPPLWRRWASVVARRVSHTLGRSQNAPA